MLSQLLPGQGETRTDFQSQDQTFQILYYAITLIQALSVPLLILSQTVCIFAYDWTVRQGLNASEKELGSAIMVQSGRAYGVADTILYIPLLCTSAYGLLTKKQWSLICTAASAGISSYWTLTSLFLLVFSSRNVEDFHYKPDAFTWVLVIFYMVYGILVLTFLYHYWKVLLRVMGD